MRLDLCRLPRLSGIALGTLVCAAACGRTALVDSTDASSDTGAGSACSQVGTLADCDARADCHPVFVDPGTCGCATIGCCAHFSSCAAGKQAVCTQPPTFGCSIPVPYCEGPAYVVAYTSVCYEGCVRMDECAP